jgi:hypothetical protein
LNEQARYSSFWPIAQKRALVERGWVDQTKQLTSESSTKPHLKPVLTLWDLIYFGVILTSPIAAVPLFGEVQVLEHRWRLWE